MVPERSTNAALAPPALLVRAPHDGASLASDAMTSSEQASKNSAAPSTAPPEAILATCENAIVRASASVDAAKEGRPSRQEVEAAAARVAEAKLAFTAMRRDISESLMSMQRQLEDDIRKGIAAVSRASGPPSQGGTQDSESGG